MTYLSLDLCEGIGIGYGKGMGCLIWFWCWPIFKILAIANPEDDIHFTIKIKITKY
jgi:hypothetical protein